jgi:hypothetical protein
MKYYDNRTNINPIPKALGVRISRMLFDLNYGDFHIEIAISVVVFLLVFRFLNR